MSVYLETWQTVIHSTTMAEFSFGFTCTEGSFLQLNGQKQLRPEDLIGNNQKITITNGEDTDIVKLSSQYLSTGHNFVLFLLGV